MFKLDKDWKKDLTLLGYSALLWGFVLVFLFKVGVADKSWLVSTLFGVFAFIALLGALVSVLRGINVNRMTFLTILTQISSLSLILFLLAVHVGGVETTESRQVVETRDFNGTVDSRAFSRGLRSVNFRVEGEEELLTLDNVDMKATFTDGTPVHHINTVIIEETRKDWFGHTKKTERTIHLVVD